MNSVHNPISGSKSARFVIENTPRICKLNLDNDAICANRANGRDRPVVEAQVFQPVPPRRHETEA